MIGLIQIMKSVFYLGAAIALLRSAAALFSHHDHQDVMVVQHAQVTNKAADLANSTTKYLETQAIAQVADASTDDAVVLDTKEEEELDESSDAGPSPKFHVGSNTSQWAITYTPYNDDETCKSPAQINTDIATIAAKGFTTLRLHATDCSALPHIGTTALTNNLTLILGIHIDDNPALTTANAQLFDIISWATTNANAWYGVEMLVVGNEAIFNADITAPSLSTYLNHTRAQLRAAGYTGPVTKTEPVAIIAEHAPLLCAAIDIAAANIQPFFHAEISAETAGVYVAEQLDVLEGVCAGLEAVNLETGWPRRGRRNGVAVPGVEEQGVAMRGILGGSGGRSVVLGFGDDGWKDEGEFGVEGSWGCGHLFGEG